MQTVSRLITEFIPETYDVYLQINRINRSFKGEVAVTGESKHGRIILHTKGLEVTSATINGVEASWNMGINDELSLTAPNLQAGVYTVVIHYSGQITDHLHGLYPCHFTHKGIKKELLMTQFESHHAREVLPCVDEPEAKATFNLTIKTDVGDTVLSNMPVKKRRESCSGQTVQFATTPRMSTYLLAFIVGELQSVRAKTKSGVDVAVWSTPAQPIESLQFALDHAVRTIEFFDEYFDVPYPLPKSDHVAVPDFSSGAMENWGLITYRETALLADPATTSISSKQYIATVIAHELSHQWFGNLVTMKWWDNLWLNESFATIMEYVAVDALHPEWEEWLEFSSQEAVLALRRDAIDGVQSVQTDVKHPDEISTLFDASIVYAKGGRLLRMMQQYVGESAFRTALKHYFTLHQYGSTTGDDLYAEMSKASKKPVGTLMNTWISQSGYPVVLARVNGNKLTLTQQQFFIGPHKPNNQLWPIPLGATLPEVPLVLDKKSITVSLTDPQATLQLNYHDSAHFITHYDQTLRSRLLIEITNGTMPVLQRMQFLHEQTLLARGGMMNSADLLDVLIAYSNEQNEKVWGMMALAIGELKKFVETNRQAEKQLRNFIGTLAHPQYVRLGWDSTATESEDDTKLRATILGCMLYSEQPAVIAEALRRYNAAPYTALDPELRGLIMSAAVRHSKDRQIIDNLLEDYQQTVSVDLKSDVAAALTSTRNKKELGKLRTLLTNTSVIRTQDHLHWFIALLRNTESRQATWEWLQNHWQWIETTFGSDKSCDYYPRYAAATLTTPAQLSEYREFFAAHKANPALTRTIDMGIRDLEGRIELIERDSPAVATRLANM
ncbi:MAG: M1 family metallopeptidase [Candidatus Saccharimonas sp.]